MSETRANDRQVGGDHYKVGELQHWDLLGPEYLMGCATKYISRWRRKNGVQDLEKALHYAEKLLEVVTRDGMPPPSTIQTRETFERWADSAGCDWIETVVMRDLLYWRDELSIRSAIAGLRHMIRTSKNMLALNPGIELGGPVRSLEVALEDAREHLRGHGVVDAFKISKPLREMTDEELETERAEWVRLQSEATGWGAAVGVRGEYIDEILAEQARRSRRVPRMTDEQPPWKKTPNTCRACGELIEGAEYCEMDFSGATHYYHDADRCRNTAAWEAARAAGPQRTSEDGAQHAGLAPWQIDRETLHRWGEGSAVKRETLGKFYRQVTARVFRLEPMVRSHHIPTEVQACYDICRSNPTIWLLRVDRVPEDLRDAYPRLQREMNAVEYDQSDEQFRHMYGWGESSQKWLLLAPYVDAWGRES